MVKIGQSARVFTTMRIISIIQTLRGLLVKDKENDAPNRNQNPVKPIK